MSFVSFLTEAKDKPATTTNNKADSQVHIYDYKHDPVDGEHGYNAHDLVVLEDVDADVEISYGTLKFSVAPVSLKDEDPVAYEVVYANIEVEFDINGDQDETGKFAIFEVSSKSKVTKDVMKLDKHDLDNYTKVQETYDRFVKDLTDTVLRNAAEAVIKKYEKFITKKHNQAIDNHKD